jgi:glucose-6-phosphate isomerase
VWFFSSKVVKLIVNMSINVSLNLSNLYGEDVPFVTKQTVEQVQDKVNSARNKINSQVLDKKYGFLQILDDQRMVSEVEEVYEKLSWAKTLVVVGIGGSDLGGRAIKNALDNGTEMDVLFHGESTDPVAIKDLLEKIELKETVFNIVSKSGGTLETLSAYVFLKNMVKQAGLEWQNHFVFTTSAESGVLKDEADQHGVKTLAVPENVGGRFSVLSAVGLLPARCMGVEIKEMLDGARAMMGNYDQVFELAKAQFELYSQDVKLAVLMPYSTQLKEFARWYRQLWAESLGKDDQGIMPIQAFGPADQHSQVQFYNQGSKLQSVWFLKVNNRKVDYVLSGVDVEAAKYLEGKSFHEIINLEAEASAEAMTKHGRPNAMIEIDKVSAFSLGQLFMLFELGVVYLAEMLGVDPFNQPGVEEGKKIMNAQLGK